ncbi:hypothetical protein KC332_g1342 [Hortaea werneckii]|nr:hypothetical protein KC350_g4977 [Hortaea werneckii]KAI6849174.1 hypothetical protein KC358_g1340 [Hortaea werneckii]KAI6931569.1 hypothetical protein KC341_g9548 [Hortaea werneckii]KAI6949616.1 hypothetical protein KC348_g1209 [Hortaea werneckii]KAI6983059.1 hypothetical protein KC321_g305 [Hortaea werneckii]
MHRFSHSVAEPHLVTSAAASRRPASAFAGNNETTRMAKVRRAIFQVRSTWGDEIKQAEIRRGIQKLLEKQKKADGQNSAGVTAAILAIADRRPDYADLRRPSTAPSAEHEYNALKLYCSEKGYNYLFRLVLDLVRSDGADENDDGALEELLTAATLVEYLTIDLYNLRLAHLSDPEYSGFEGSVCRGMAVSPYVVEDFRAIARQPQLSERSFSIPLAMISTTVEESVMWKFSKSKEFKDRLHWIIHVRSLRPDLLARYQQQYPDSVITSICAMPVYEQSCFRGEREVLLRGPFFQMLRMTTEDRGFDRVHTCELLMLNSNRDHGTELGSNEGAKAAQRMLLTKAVRITRNLACAEMVREYAQSDAIEYERLGNAELAEFLKM